MKKLLFTLVTLLIPFLPRGACQTAGTLTSPNLNDPRQAGLPGNAYSYMYLSPWKSYMDTWSGQKFLDGLGVNFRPGGGNEAGTAKVLADAGFTHARIEFGWSRLQYTDDTQIGTDLPTWTALLNALKANNIRPLILLNNNQGGMCPFTLLSLTATATSAVGATTITVASTTGIVLGKTGLSSQKSGYQSYPFIKSIAGNVCTLSAPLLVQITNGATIPCVTLKYHPICTGGLANSFTAETIAGWQKYVTTICTFVNSILGNNNFDIEVYNEGTAALDDNNFYSPANATTGSITYTSTVYPTYTFGGTTFGDGREVLTPLTVDIVKTSFPGVRIINGFGNLRPQDNAFDTPPGVTAFSRHNYTDLNGVAPITGFYGVSNPSNPLFGGIHPPTNALYGYDGTPVNSATAPALPNPSTVTAGSFFIPSFTLSCPESFVGMGMKLEWMCEDLLPFPGLRIDGSVSTIYRGAHWRGGLNPITNQTVGLWETETNTDRRVWVDGIMTPTQRDTDPTSINLWMYAGAKSLTRMFVFDIHKGMQTVCAFADRDANNPYVLSIIPESFYTALSANGGVLTPAIQAQAGPQIAAMQGMTTLFKQNMNSIPFTVTPLSVTSISAYKNVIDFSGDGTAAHPDWRHLDGFGVFPFQASSSTYIIGHYVVTPDVVHNWNFPGNTGPLDVRNYHMPDEDFNVTLSGFPFDTSSPNVTVTGYDPLTQSTVPVTVISSTSNTITVKVATTDTPRFMVIHNNPVSTGNLRFGFATHFGQGWNINLMPKIAATGVGYIRDDLNVGQWEPVPGTYAISAGDKVWIDAAHVNGLKVVGILNKDTSYVSGDPYDPTFMTNRAKFIAQSGLVDVIEVTNEPNNDFATVEGGTWKTKLATLTTAVRNGVHAVAPNIPVIGLGAQGSQIIGLIPSTTVDGIVYHPYDYTNSEPDTVFEQPEGVNATSSLLYTPWIAILNAATALPLWETEWGKQMINGITEDEQASFLIRRMVRSAGLGVEHSFIYEFKDNGGELFGIYNDAGTTAKLAYSCVTRTITALAGVTGDPTSVVTISNVANGNSTDATAQAFQGATRTVVAYWFANHGVRTPPASSTVSLSFTVPHAHQNSVLLNPFTGASVPLSTYKTCTNNGTGFSISGLPISDHPMLILMQ